MTQGLLFLVPALAILATLFSRRYPGERVVLDLRRRCAAARPARRRPASTSAPRRASRRSYAVIRRRGGDLLGRSLAVRPPPRCAPIAAV